MTLNNIFSKLRKQNTQNYKQFIFCLVFAVVLVTSFSITVFSPFIQGTLPEGGDSRKWIYMIFVVALVGCMVFCLYAASLFFRYKSKETGVFLALGAEKKKLSRALFSEIGLIAGVCFGAGLIIGSGAAFLIGFLFRSVAVSMPENAGTLSFTGLGIPVLFCIIMLMALLLMAISFMARTNLMEILNEQRRNEPVKSKVMRKYAVTGIILLAAGVFGGLLLPAIVAGLLERNIGFVSNLFYVLCVIGLYMLLVYSVAVHKRGNNPKKYYKSMIFYGMMKFQGASVVKNMLIITLLLIAALYACFYGPTQFSAGQMMNRSNPVDFAYHYQSDVDEVTEEEVFRLGDEYGVQVMDFRETQLIRLLASGIERENYDSHGKLIEAYQKQLYYSEFISESEFNRVTGQNLQVPAGAYRQIKAAATEEDIWNRFGEMNYVKNTATGVEMNLEFDGTADYQGLVRGDGFTVNLRYVINDSDFTKLSKGLPESLKVTQVLFNAGDLDSSYEFGKTLYREYCLRVPAEMKRVHGYDEFQEAKAKKAGENYDYGEIIQVEPDRSEIDLGWKYKPDFKILNLKNTFSSFIIQYLLFLYVAVIGLAAVGIIGYTRSVSVGISSRQTFEDLRRLGASHQYVGGLIAKQLQKVYVLPTVLGCALTMAYNLLMLWQNDGRLTLDEWMTLGIGLGIILVIVLYQYILYRASLKKVKNMVQVKA